MLVLLPFLLSLWPFLVVSLSHSPSDSPEVLWPLRALRCALFLRSTYSHWDDPRIHFSSPDLSLVLQIPNIQLPNGQAPKSNVQNQLSPVFPYSFPVLVNGITINLLEQARNLELSSTPYSPLYPINHLVISFLPP